MSTLVLGMIKLSLNTNEIPDELSHKISDIFTSENSMLFSHLKITLLWLHITVLFNLAALTARPC